MQPEPPTWLGSDRLLARVVGRPVTRFLHIEAGGGLVLLAATVAALVWANSPWSQSYVDLWHTSISVTVGSHTISEDLRHWVNDGLMAVFFFVVGLEIKRELVVGQLASFRDAAVPVVAAIGGMVVPAAIYLAFNSGGPGAAGWGIPMATDIAFALGVLALLGSRVPPALKILLLGLAIVDDIGAIVVIAIFYTEQLALGALAVALGGLALVVILRRAGVWYPPLYGAVGVVVWVATLESGIHATLAGVALGLLTPARPLMSDLDADRIAHELSPDAEVTATEVKEISFRLRASVSVAERLEEGLHPWASYFCVPMFALANAGLVISSDAVSDAVGSSLAIGVFLGLVVGKLVGVTLATWLAVRFGLGRLPEGVAWRDIVGMAALAGIGFTVSLFIGGLAFSDPLLVDQAKMGVLAASVVAAAVGVLLLRSPRHEPGGPPPVADTGVR